MTCLDEAAGRDCLTGGSLSSCFVGLDSILELAELHIAVTDHTLYRRSYDGLIGGELLQLSEGFLILPLVVEANTAVGMSEVSSVRTREVLSDGFEAWGISTLTLEGEAVLSCDEAILSYKHLRSSLLRLRHLDEAMVGEDTESDDDYSRYCDDDLLAVTLEEEFTFQHLLVVGIQWGKDTTFQATLPAPPQSRQLT